ncbi:MAG: hypothetical protein M1831_000227 [Alyxoria varia]|nr:MAG: hypothetical protein M1831_000227 [Alyxoria varia]
MSRLLEIVRVGQKFDLPKFELSLRIIDLNNVPLVSGTSYVKWNLPHSAAAEHRGRTDKCQIRDHKVFYDYDKDVLVRLTVDRNGMLQESTVEFEVLQEYSTSARGEKIVLGYVRLNLAEYVDVDESETEEGVCRRYLMRDSKINSTLKIRIFMKLVEGDRNYTVPPLKNAPVFGGIAGIMAGEQGEPDDVGHMPSSMNNKSREHREFQDTYRRNLAAYWAAQPGELKADECIENIFAGGDGWGRDSEGDRNAFIKNESETDRNLFGGPEGTLKPEHARTRSGGMPRAGDTSPRLRNTSPRKPEITHSSSGVSGRASLEQHANSMKAEAAASNRDKTTQEIDEFDIREDLRSWRLPDNLSPADATPAGKVSPRTVGWTSLLKSSYLGRTASVLVLRDSEEKSRPKKGYTLQEKKLQDVNVNELMRSVETQKNVSGQEDVNRSIDAYRPHSLEHDGPIVVAEEKLNEMGEDLAQSFNIQQLSRYISIKEGEKVLNHDHQARSKESDRTSLQPTRSDWFPMHTRINAKALSRRSNVQRGKRNLVNVILRSVWGIKTAEETRRLGALTMSLHSATFTLLATGSESDLTRISRMFNVSVDMSSSQKELTIRGDRSSCLLAADAIDNQLDQVFHTSIDLRPLQKYASITELDVQDLSVKTQAIADLVDNNQSLAIQAKEQAQIDHFRRALLSLVGIPASQHVIMVSDESDRSLEGVLIAKPVDERLLGQTEEHRWTGRFASAQFLFKDDEVLRQNLATTLSRDSFDRAFENLCSHQRTEPVGATTTYTAEMGETRFEMESGANPRPCRLSELATLVNTEKPSFAHIAPGLTHLLLHKTTVPPISSKNSILVNLIPSPWQRHQQYKAITNPLPSLSVEIDVDPQSKSTQLRALSASTAEREAHLLLPRIATDVKLRRSDDVRLSCSELEPEVARYIHWIQASTEGYGKVNAPSHLRCRLPSSLSRASGAVELAHDVDVEYHTSNIAFVHEMEFDLDGFKLVCCRETEDLGLKTERVYLRICHDHLHSDALQSQRPDLSLESKEQLFTTLCTVLKWLNLGVGNTNLLFHDPSTMLRKLQRKHTHIDLSDSKTNDSLESYP